MKLHIIRDAKDHNKLTVHLDVNLDKFRVKKEKWMDSDCFSRFGDLSDDATPPRFRNNLLQIKGIQEVAFDKYSIDIVKGEVFDWTVLVRQIRACLELNLNDGDQAEYSGAYSSKTHQVQKCHQKESEKIPRV